MKYQDWKKVKQIEQTFLNSLERLCKMFGMVAKGAGSNYTQFLNAMGRLQNSQAYKNYINTTLLRMLKPIARQNQAVWKRAMASHKGSKLMYKYLMEELKKGTGRAIQSQLLQNAALISTLPMDVAQKVVNDVTSEAYKGKRAEEIATIIQEQTSKHSRASARLIARTEVSKANTALTRARAEEIGLRWYVWRTAEDGDRVRKSHRNMEGVIVNWNEPPSPEALVGEPSVGNYHAGNIWNCRCYPSPLIEIDDVSWPHKVYTQGTIRTIGKREFEQMF